MRWHAGNRTNASTATRRTPTNEPPSPAPPILSEPERLEPLQVTSPILSVSEGLAAVEPLQVTSPFVSLSLAPIEEQPSPPIEPASPLSVEERIQEPIATASASISSLDGLCGENSVLEGALEVQVKTHPDEKVKFSERFLPRHPKLLCSVRFQSVLEKDYSFQHLTERLLEAEGSLEAIRGEGRALFDQFQAHERYLVADLVDLFLSHVMRGVIERMDRQKHPDVTFQRYLFALQAPLQAIVAPYVNELRANGGAWMNAGRQMEGLFVNLLLLRRSFNL